MGDDHLSGALGSQGSRRGLHVGLASQSLSLDHVGLEDVHQGQSIRLLGPRDVLESVVGRWLRTDERGSGVGRTFRPAQPGWCP